MAPLLLAGLAGATTLATTFDADAGGWSGGTVAAGTLTVRDAATLAPGPLARFRLVARLRVAEGTGVSFTAGDARFDATYGVGGRLSLDGTAAPFPLAEQAWTADAAPVLAGAAPDVLRRDDGWLLYREVDGVVHVATSPDGSAWTDAGSVLAGGAPDAVDTGAGVALHYACGADVCRAASDDGVTFLAEGPVLAGAGPSVAARPDGGWRMWFADGASVATAVSADARAWSDAGTVGSGRLGEVDVVALASGTHAVWAEADGVHALSTGPDADLADASADRGPILFTAPACAGVPGAPTLALDGDTWRLWAACDGAVSHFRGAPSPGGWVGFVAEWDGATLTVTWSAGPTLSTPLAAADALVFATDGAVALDEALVSYTLAGGDTGDTGIGGDTADTGETGAADTADSADTDISDTADTALATDTAPAPPAYGAAELTGEPGGCGCDAPAAAPGGALLLAGLVAARRRRADLPGDTRP